MFKTIGIGDFINVLTIHKTILFPTVQSIDFKVFLIFSGSTQPESFGIIPSKTHEKNAPKIGRRASAGAAVAPAGIQAPARRHAA